MLFVVCFVDGAAEVRLLVDPVFAVPLVPDDRVRVDCCVRSGVYRAFVRRSSRFASVYFGAPCVSICYVSFCRKVVALYTLECVDVRGVCLAAVTVPVAPLST